MQDSLLSRFDLLFIVLDQVGDQKLSKVARELMRVDKREFV